MPPTQQPQLVSQRVKVLQTLPKLKNCLWAMMEEVMAKLFEKQMLRLISEMFKKRNKFHVLNDFAECGAINNTILQPQAY